MAAGEEGRLRIVRWCLVALLRGSGEAEAPVERRPLCRSANLRARGERESESERATEAAQTDSGTHYCHGSVRCSSIPDKVRVQEECKATRES